jgi:hypothetical protein
MISRQWSLPTTAVRSESKCEELALSTREEHADRLFEQSDAL